VDQLGPLLFYEVLDCEKMSFGPSKWPQKFMNRKTVKNSKFPKKCFESVGQGGWPPRSSWIILFLFLNNFQYFFNFNNF
jgi:galactose-1-phosphate uridylyltransferase